MAADTGPGPAARILAAATDRNAALGHENLGALSASHGFLAQRPPAHDLPRPQDAWVEAVDELPELCRNLRVRSRLEELPMLDASPEALDDRHLLRAASVLGLLVHAYSNMPMRKPDKLPEQLVRPWLQTAERLARPAFTLTNSDYIFDNWRLLDPHAPDPMRVANMRTLNAIWDHPEMETFVLVLVELLARSAPLVGSAVRAQEACLRQDDDALKAELMLMTATIGRLTHESLAKISANSRSGSRRVDPVVWTKLFAMLPLPVQGAPEEVRNASGAETPYFHLMDVVLGRRLYDTQLGHEAMGFRANHPRHWRDFIAAVGTEPIADYVRRSADGELSDLFTGLAEAYHGRHGLLARHRIKAFAYMDASFKTGRSSTVTGFSGLFEDRAWERIDASFEAARIERERSTPASPRLARVEHVGDLCGDVRGVALDVRGLGLACKPGDRCAVLPQNEPAMVTRTLQALRASGKEQVELTAEWVDALARRAARPRKGRASLRDLLTFGHIRPAPRATVKLLYKLSADQDLRAILHARTEDRWELWDLLELLRASGFAPQRLWQQEGVGDTALCTLIPPLEPRLYSVSAIHGGAHGLERIELTVKHLTYESVDPVMGAARRRRGTASTYLCHTVRPGDEIPVSIVSAAGFSTPSDTPVPIVMLAEGVGIAPFVGFLAERSQTPGTQNLLFAETPITDDLPHRDLLLDHAARGEAEVHLAFSTDPGSRRGVEGVLRQPATRSHISELLRARDEGGAGARLYVCGSASFARSMMAAVADALAEPGRAGREMLADLIVRYRYVQDVLPEASGAIVRPRIDPSELARHTTAVDGIWAAIDGRVYDLTAFAEIHPGGHKLIKSFAGMDAGASYRVVEHHRDPAVQALLAVFEIGTIRRLDFDADDLVEGLFRDWARGLGVLVEIENAHRLDTSIQTEPLSRAEGARGPARTPFRLQFAIEAHCRFVRQTLPTVCRCFGRVWRATAGPLSIRASGGALDDELERILDGPAAQAARRHCDELERELEQRGATIKLEGWLARLQAADAGYLSSAKSLLASGLRAFEVHEAGVLVEGGEALLGALRGLPALTGGYLDAASRGAGG